jgi:hypothetical protein
MWSLHLDMVKECYIYAQLNIIWAAPFYVISLVLLNPGTKKPPISDQIHV